MLAIPALGEHWPADRSLGLNGQPYTPNEPNPMRKLSQKMSYETDDRQLMLTLSLYMHTHACAPVYT